MELLLECCSAELPQCSYQSLLIIFAAPTKIIRLRIKTTDSRLIQTHWCQLFYKFDWWFRY